MQGVLQGLWWLVVVVGLGAAGTFLCMHRPRHWFRARAFNATGWVIIIFLLYVRAATTVLAGGGVPRFQGTSDAVINILFGAAIDFLLVVRIFSFLDYVRVNERGVRKVDSIP